MAGIQYNNGSTMKSGNIFDDPVWRGIFVATGRTTSGDGANTVFVVNIILSSFPLNAMPVSKFASCNGDTSTFS